MYLSAKRISVSCLRWYTLRKSSAERRSVAGFSNEPLYFLYCDSVRRGCYFAEYYCIHQKTSGGETVAACAETEMADRMERRFCGFWNPQKFCVVSVVVKTA